MLASQRRAAIVDIVERLGAVKVAELTKRLGVSDMTVRRDLEALDAQGIIIKEHGGARRTGGLTFEPNFVEKSGLNLADKEAIAARAATLIRPGMCIGISGGSTTYLLAQHLRNIGELTVVTNSLPVAEALMPLAPAVSLLITGGEPSVSRCLVGPIAERALQEVSLDVSFIGAHAMNARGLSTPNLHEAQTNRCLVQSGAKTVAMVDASKWDTAALANFATWSRVGQLVTGADLPASAGDVLRESQVEVVLAN